MFFMLLLACLIAIPEGHITQCQDFCKDRDGIFVIEARELYPIETINCVCNNREEIITNSRRPFVIPEDEE